MNMETLSQKRSVISTCFNVSHSLSIFPQNDYWTNNHYKVHQHASHDISLYTFLLHVFMFLSSDCLILTLPPSVTLSHPLVCNCGRLCVRLCAEGRARVRRGFRRWAWRVLCRMPTSWRWTLSSSWATPSWVERAARWASDIQTALCWPARPCDACGTRH